MPLYCAWILDLLPIFVHCRLTWLINTLSRLHSLNTSTHRHRDKRRSMEEHIKNVAWRDVYCAWNLNILAISFYTVGSRGCQTHTQSPISHYTPSHPSVISTEKGIMAGLRKGNMAWILSLNSWPPCHFFYTVGSRDLYIHTVTFT